MSDFDFNSPEKTEIDVESLMGLIRRRAAALPDARYIMGEIEKCGRYAEGIAQPPPARAGWKGRAKSRVSRFVLRAVGLNLRFQEAFNQRAVKVLQLVADDLYAHEKRLDADGAGDPAARQPNAARGVKQDESSATDASPPAERFDRVGYEEKYVDAASFKRRSLSVCRELLGEDDVALELCCGRGELLAAFAESGVKAVGVDPDARMVDVCRGRGLRALQADVIDYLRGSPDESFGGVFGGRVVERLTNEQTVELLALSGEKLRRGGVLVLGATNVDHLPALRDFYADPSLVRPVPVRLLGFMLERSGLRLDRFIFSGPDAEAGGGAELSEVTLSREVYPYNRYTAVCVRD